MDEDTKSFIRGQIDVIDRMLFNAYGTVYKIAAKYIMYEEIGHHGVVRNGRTIVCQESAV